mmetsp:Transcript_41418/g.113989  ORF Transcript_41418/g.113989 Transcript_41418/m.113989 type:complete len:209 (+) Transcript_41418:389-1015(+)
MQSTRVDESGATTAGRTHATRRARRLASISRRLDASTVKSSSAACSSCISRSTGRRSSSGSSHASHAPSCSVCRKSCVTIVATSSCCTLMTTELPSTRVARCTCAMEATDMGVGSTEAMRARRLSAPRSSIMVPRTRESGRCGLESSIDASSFPSAAGTTSARVAMYCPNLTQSPPRPSMCRLSVAPAASCVRSHSSASCTSASSLSE